MKTFTKIMETCLKFTYDIHSVLKETPLSDIFIDHLAVNCLVITESKIIS